MHQPCKAHGTTKKDVRSGCLDTNLFLDGVLPGEQLLASARGGRVGVGGVPDLLLPLELRRDDEDEQEEDEHHRPRIHPRARRSLIHKDNPTSSPREKKPKQQENSGSPAVRARGGGGCRCC